MVEPWQPGPVLGIESSCDETAAAVLDMRAEGVDCVLSDVVASQVKLHAPHGGVVPELASRQHLRDIQQVVARALGEAGVELPELAGVAVTCGPGLVGPLLVGVSFAKSLVLRRSLPLVGIHHLEGHVRAAFIEHEEPAGDYLALIVSGGHSSLFRVSRRGSLRSHECLARTLDDAAGEAYDKVGKMLGLAYPAGPAVDRLAASFRGEPVFFRRARIKVDGGRGVTHRAFSFSGVKTAVRQYLQRERIAPVSSEEEASRRPEVLALLAGFQEAVVDMLVIPTMKILAEEGLRDLVVVGGVSANRHLRLELERRCAAKDVRLMLPQPRWSTDNAAMIAAAGWLHLAAGERAGLGLSANPQMVLGGVA